MFELSTDNAMRMKMRMIGGRKTSSSGAIVETEGGWRGASKVRKPLEGNL